MKRRVRLKKLMLLTLLTFLISGTVQAAETRVIANASFSDVKNYQEEIRYLTKLGIIKGYTDGTFKPTANLKRIQAVDMILREMKITNFNAPNPGFTDMKPGTYGYEKVAKAVELGFITGQISKDGSKKFNPNATLTRGQMAKILTEAYGLDKNNNISFTDVPTGHWVKPFVSRLASAGITSGYPDESFKPNDKIQRQHFSVFMARYLNPAFKLAPIQTKDTFMSIASAERHLLSPVPPYMDILFEKMDNNMGYSATLMPSSDPRLSARYGVVYIWKGSKKLDQLHINTQRYRDNKYLQAHGDLIIQSASEAFFGKNSTGAKQIQEFIYANMNAKPSNSYIYKTMTFGGHKADVVIGEWDIKITFP